MLICKKETRENTFILLIMRHFSVNSTATHSETNKQKKPVYSGPHNCAWLLLVKEGFSRKQLCAFTQRSEHGGFL